MRIYYSADVRSPYTIVRDDSGLEIDGDMRQESGWIDPDWSRTTVHADRGDVTPDAWEPDDGPLIDWLAEQVSRRVGYVEWNTTGTPRTFTCADGEMADATGVSTLLTAHLDGVPDVIARAVAYTIAHHQTYRGRA